MPRGQINITSQYVSAYFEAAHGQTWRVGRPYLARGDPVISKIAVAVEQWLPVPFLILYMSTFMDF